MAPHTRWLITLGSIIATLLIIGGTLACEELTTPREVSIERMTTCKVVRLRSSTKNKTACMVECSRRPGSYEATVSSIPVSCEDWYGEEVTRE